MPYVNMHMISRPFSSCSHSLAEQLRDGLKYGVTFLSLTSISQLLNFKNGESNMTCPFLFSLCYTGCNVTKRNN